MVWARRCTASCSRKIAPAAGSMRPWARIAIFWPTSCDGCLKTARTRASSTRSWTRPCPPKSWRPDPFEQVKTTPNHRISKGPDLYLPARINAKGFDLGNALVLDAVQSARADFAAHQWSAAPLLAGTAKGAAPKPVLNPADHADQSGTVANATAADVETAFATAKPWSAPLDTRRAVLNRASDLLEARHAEIFALLAREAGKTLLDGVAELREAVDFLRYYASQATDEPAAGTFTCISPWNFPLAIFCGQVSAALAAGNAVLAKPAEQTPLIAHLAVSTLHEAGVPAQRFATAARRRRRGCDADLGFEGEWRGLYRFDRHRPADQIGDGRALRARHAADCRNRWSERDDRRQHRPAGTGRSGGRRKLLPVRRSALLRPALPLCAGGHRRGSDKNADRCDAEPEDGQSVAHLYRCRPRDRRDRPQGDCRSHRGRPEDGRVIAELKAPEGGTYIAPTIIKVKGIGDLEREIFGPVLHLATFKSRDLDKVIDAINGTGYGLTFGLHTRIDDRVQHVAERIEAGNVYINRNQIGAIVGSQPFGGEGLSGTGPKAGGPTLPAALLGARCPACLDRLDGGDDIAARPARPQPTGTDHANPARTHGRIEPAEHPAAPALLCIGTGRGGSGGAGTRSQGLGRHRRTRPRAASIRRP